MVVTVLTDGHHGGGFRKHLSLMPVWETAKPWNGEEV